MATSLHTIYTSQRPIPEPCDNLNCEITNIMCICNPGRSIQTVITLNYIRKYFDTEANKDRLYHIINFHLF